MASIKDTSRLLCRVCLANLMSKPGLYITPLLSGKHGIGKSAIINQTAKRLNGKAIIVEGGELKEGEITGLPVAVKTDDGGSELNFIPYYAIKNIQKIQKYYYDIATKTGFLGGDLKVLPDGNTEYYTINKENKVKEKHIIEKKSIQESILLGDSNAYEFGENLPPEIKLKLIESGEITFTILFVDELNRAEMPVMKELMNINLNRAVNGYNLPWWVNIISAINPGSQNSVYAVNEFDDAQLSRFLKIKVDANINEWVDYALENNISEDIVDGITVSGEEVFNRKVTGQDDTDEMYPDPRAWEMVGTLYDSIKMFNNSKFIYPEERDTASSDLKILMAAKVGSDAARTVLQNIENKENDIHPSDIINGEHDVINPKIVIKFNNQINLRKKVISDRVIKYLCETVLTFEKYKHSSKPEDKPKWNNYASQLRQFIDLLDGATRLVFIKKIAQMRTTLATDGTSLYWHLATEFSKDMLDLIEKFKENVDSLSNK